MSDYRGKLIADSAILKNWLEEHALTMTEQQAKKAIYKLGEIWSILERRRNVKRKV